MSPYRVPAPKPKEPGPWDGFFWKYAVYVLTVIVLAQLAGLCWLGFIVLVVSLF